jgi:hypothetical protein
MTKKTKPIYWVRVLYIEDGVEREIDALTPCVRVRPYKPSTTPNRLNLTREGFAFLINELDAGEYVYVPTEQSTAKQSERTWLLVRIVHNPPETGEALAPRDTYVRDGEDGWTKMPDPNAKCERCSDPVYCPSCVMDEKESRE